MDCAGKLMMQLLFSTYTEIFVLISWICPSFGVSPTMELISANNTIAYEQKANDDPLADDVDWISAVSGMVIIVGIAMCYAMYILLRQQKERKEQDQRDNQFSVMMSTRNDQNNAGQQAQLNDFH